MWYEDPLFLSKDKNDLTELGSVASPAFRVSVQTSVKKGDPLNFVEEYSAVFDIFEPILRAKAERLTMIEKPGGHKSRRRKSIRPDDWRPFHHMASVLESSVFVGFDFKSGRSDRLYDIGSTGFRLRVGRTVQLDATISVADYLDGAIDEDRLRAALLNLPLSSAVVGYGMAISSYFDACSKPRELLLPVARKYPALDICPSPLRQWFSLDSRKDNTFYHWLSGISWWTIVSEPYLSECGGPDAIRDGLSDEILIDEGRGSILYQLGERPITGEFGEDDDLLPLYFALGQRLAPREGCRGSQGMARGYVFGDRLKPFAKASIDWDRRFYDRRWFERGD